MTMIHVAKVGSLGSRLIVSDTALDCPEREPHRRRESRDRGYRYGIYRGVVMGVVVVFTQVWCVVAFPAFTIVIVYTFPGLIYFI